MRWRLARLQSCDISNPNVKAFLKLLRWLENYPDDTDADYTRMFGGGKFSDMTKHPNVVNTKWGKSSTAAGAYMFVYGTWKEAKDKGVIKDFSDASQDQLAWWKIGQRHAQVAVCAGSPSLEKAFQILRPEWSSLPGASQNQVSAQEAGHRYDIYLSQFSLRK